MKKIIIFVLCIFLSLPVFADNILQQKYEANNVQKLKGIPYHVIYLINDDYDGYKNGGGSLYGVISYQIEQCKKEHRAKDLEYLEQASSMYEYAYNSQSKENMQYVYIEDEDYQNISEGAKNAISSYNMLYLLSQIDESNIDFDKYYDKLNNDKQEYSANKNNMKRNKELCTQYYQTHEETDKYIEFLQSINNAKYSKNNGIYEYGSVGKYADVIQNFKDLSKNCENFSNEIYKYSYAYEKNKYQNWLIKNNKKPIGGTLQQFVYDGRYQPKTGYIYTHDPKDLFLIVKQTVPGGVIVSGRHDIGGGFHTINDIFLQTTKSFADGAYITEPIFAEYKGFYDYTTVMGARRRIYKFYRYGQNEIKANFQIPSEKFYFYGWDGKWY